ncbi:MAG: phage holin family protein [Eggerthellaceae bacterium]|nr:phage holin family protein [Eggerthellaceae bacterium]
MNFLIRWIATAVAVGAAVWLVPGITTVGSNATVAIIVGALVLSLVNITIKPIVQLISSPISVLTLGLFYIVVNALLLELAAWASTALFGSGIAIESFGWAFIGSIIISIVSAIMNGILGKDE